MINIGLTGWGDHYSLYEDLERQTDKLKTYAGHFPVVELDATYYAIQPERNILKWIKETPDTFEFVVKIHQALTLHADYKTFADTRQELFDQFKNMLEPLHTQKKLAMVLVQFPPWFDCNAQNIKYILYVRQQLQAFPMCVEFRHQSWFSDAFKEQTLAFLTEHQIIHAVVDEPQVKDGSVPYLYDYNEQELIDLAQKAQILAQKAKKVYVIFNNNSGGHAANNAKTYQRLLNIEYEGLAPQQLKLF
ncbi:TPA: DUF72 domain-containing protein [Staphylococcus aureus]|nr:DUF72 domain-containing protein [Staphylococcus aureus]